MGVTELTRHEFNRCKDDSSFDCQWGGWGRDRLERSQTRPGVPVDEKRCKVGFYYVLASTNHL